MGASVRPNSTRAPALDDEQSSATAPGSLLLSWEAAASAYLGRVVGTRDDQQPLTQPLPGAGSRAQG